MSVLTNCQAPEIKEIGTDKSAGWYIGAPLICMYVFLENNHIYIEELHNFNLN